MRLVDVCSILCRNSERATEKPVAVAEECEGGPVTLDLTTSDFNKADCRTRCRKLIENSTSSLLMGSPIDSHGEDEEQTRVVLHLAFICELYEIQVREQRYFLHTHSHSAKSWDQPAVVDFMNRFPDTFQTVTDRSLFGANVPHGMNTLTRWLTKSGYVAQALSSLTPTVCQTIMSAMSQQLQSDLCVAAAKDQPQHRPLLPKLDSLAVDPDEELQEEWDAEDDVKGDHWTNVRSKLPLRRK